MHKVPYPGSWIGAAGSCKSEFFHREQSTMCKRRSFGSVAKQWPQKAFIGALRKAVIFPV
jgi:hypothetical protein